MKVYAIVLAAGKGTRMKSDKPKVVHEVLYKPMINHVVDELKALGVDETIVIVGHEADQVKAIVDDVTFVDQTEQLGTGHAVLQAKDILANRDGMTLVLCGDAPLIRKETLKEFGLTFSGTSPDGLLIEIVEIKKNDWFVACQFHPEFKSRPQRPHPLFDGLVEAIVKQKEV